MQIAGLIIGILSMVGMVVGFIPCLGSLNWINIPLAIIGLIVSIIGFTNAPQEEPKGKATSGIVLCSIAIIFGMFRLMIGGGIF